MIVVLSIAESPDRIARAEAFKTGTWLRPIPEESSLAQHLVPSTSPHHNQRCLGTFDRNSESEKSEVGTTGRPLISVPKGSPAEERDTSTHRSDRGKARPVGSKHE